MLDILGYSRIKPRTTSGSALVGARRSPSHTNPHPSKLADGLEQKQIIDKVVCAVRDDSEEEAARLALEGADYDMEKWHNDYQCDPFVETTACDVHLATGRDVGYADRQHLLKGRPPEPHSPTGWAASRQETV